MRSALFALAALAAAATPALPQDIEAAVGNCLEMPYCIKVVQLDARAAMIVNACARGARANDLHRCYAQTAPYLRRSEVDYCIDGWKHRNAAVLLHCDNTVFLRYHQHLAGR